MLAKNLASFKMGTFLEISHLETLGVKAFLIKSQNFYSEYWMYVSTACKHVYRLL